MSLRRRVMGQKEVNDLFVGAEGTFDVPEGQTTSITISHGLGIAPFLVIVEPVGFSGVNANVVLGGMHTRLSPNVTVPYWKSGSVNTFATVGVWTNGSHQMGELETQNTNGGYVNSVTDSSFIVRATSNYPLWAGTYKWRAFAFKELGGNQ